MAQLTRHLLAYLIPTFAIGYFWHLKWFHDRYRQLNIYRAEPIIPLGFSSMLVQGCIVAYVYPRLATSPASFTDAFAFSAGAALLSWSFTTLAVAAKHSIASVRSYLALETAFTAAQFALVAPMLALTSRF